MIQTGWVDKSNVHPHSLGSIYIQLMHVYAIHFLKKTFVFILFPRTYLYMLMSSDHSWCGPQVIIQPPTSFPLLNLQFLHSESCPTFNCFPLIWQISIACYSILSKFLSWYTITQNTKDIWWIQSSQYTLYKVEVVSCKVNGARICSHKEKGLHISNNQGKLNWKILLNKHALILLN